MSRLEKLIAPCPMTGCWLWIGAKKKRGYGSFGVNVSGAWKTKSVHKFIYELTNGPVPKGLELDHLCKTPSCCNPAHLEAVTHRENVIRGTAPAGVKAWHESRTHCPHGHEYSGENLYLYRLPNGRQQRMCVTCNRLRARKRKHRPVPG